jgi:hypothetical protein
MSKIALTPNASGTGTFTVAAPNSNSDRTLTLPDATGTVVLADATQTLTNKTIQGGAITLGTAVASTSGTAIDFTGIPSWAKRVTVMLSGVSFASSPGVVQFLVGTSGGFASSYSAALTNASGFNTESTTAGSLSTFPVGGNGVTHDGTTTWNGRIVLSNLTGNTWVMNGFLATTGTGTSSNIFGGAVVLSGVLDRVRLTNQLAVAFDAGTINVSWEG